MTSRISIISLAAMTVGLTAIAQREKPVPEIKAARERIVLDKKFPKRKGKGRHKDDRWR